MFLSWTLIAMQVLSWWDDFVDLLCKSLKISNGKFSMISVSIWRQRMPICSGSTPPWCHSILSRIFSAPVRSNITHSSPKWWSNFCPNSKCGCFISRCRCERILQLYRCINKSVVHLSCTGSCSLMHRLLFSRSHTQYHVYQYHVYPSPSILDRFCIIHSVIRGTNSPRQGPPKVHSLASWTVWFHTQEVYRRSHPGTPCSHRASAWLPHWAAGSLCGSPQSEDLRCIRRGWSEICYHIWLTGLYERGLYHLEKSRLV